MRRAAKIDANQTAIVAALRKAGAMVQSLAAVGNGCPDLLVVRCGRAYLLEVKDPSKPPSARRLTDDQEQWHAEAGARGYCVPVVETVEDALAAVGLTR